MSLQNRVQPTGEIIAHPARGTLMGNRGILHDARRRLGHARWRHKGWVCCLPAFKNRRRALMQPGHYTELFFLDEAVAFAAGHRPCAECRRADYERFRDAWSVASGERAGAQAMDNVLHAARTVKGRGQMRRWEGRARDLPDGTFFLEGATPALVWRGRGHACAPDGYGAAKALPRGTVQVLTARPLTQVLAAGYRPSLHPSLAY